MEPRHFDLGTVWLCPAACSRNAQLSYMHVPVVITHSSKPAELDNMPEIIGMLVALRNRTTEVCESAYPTHADYNQLHKDAELVVVFAPNRGSRFAYTSAAA